MLKAKNRLSTLGPKSPGKQEAVAVMGSSWPHFERIFMISALTGNGVDDLKVRHLKILMLNLWSAVCSGICAVTCCNMKGLLKKWRPVRFRESFSMLLFGVQY